MDESKAKIKEKTPNSAIMRVPFWIKRLSLPAAYNLRHVSPILVRHENVDYQAAALQQLHPAPLETNQEESPYKLR